MTKSDDVLTKKGAIDYRVWIQELQDQGLLVVIDDELDPQEEVGAVIRLANEQLSPAQLFTNIKGAIRGSKVLGGPYSRLDRVATAFGLPADVQPSHITDFYSRAFSGERRVKPEIVQDGVCQENVQRGENIDLNQLPVIQPHPQDGGPYIWTLNTGVCRDFDRSWVNWGTYRAMVHDKKTTGLFLAPLNHGGQIFEKYCDNKTPMEYAMFFGGDPIHMIVSSSSVPWGVPEVEIIGGIRGEPVKLVKCVSVDLHVPANAEIVLEGTITPGDEMMEGPFGEYPGYVVSGSNLRPVLRLSALTFRNDPILPVACCGTPVDETLMWGLQIASSVKEGLREKGAPFLDVAVPEFSGCHSVVVSTKTPYAGIPQYISRIVWTDRNGMYFPYVIVVDEDVDPWKLGEVFHAVCTKCNPATDIYTFSDVVNNPLTPYISNHPLRELGGGGGNVLFDCTWPVAWTTEQRPHRLAFKNTYSEAVKEKVLGNFSRWGLGSP